MNVSETIKYLREKGVRYLYEGQAAEDEVLIDRGKRYLELADELEDHVR